MKYILIYVNFNDNKTEYLNSEFSSFIELEAYVLAFHSKFTSFEIVATRK
jgi:hypothetical protein